MRVTRRFAVLLSSYSVPVRIINCGMKRKSSVLLIIIMITQHRVQGLLELASYSKMELAGPFSSSTEKIPTAASEDEQDGHG